jgi:ABC-2 type transport system permease protein
MFMRILVFEIRQWLKRVSTWVYVGLLFSLAFLTMLSLSGYFKGVQVGLAGSGGTVHINSPYVLCLVIGILGYMGVIITAAVMANAGARDFTSHTHPLLFTCPITKWQYLGARYAGALLTLIFMFSSLGLGLWLATSFPGLDAAKLGPNRLMFYLQPYLVLLLPNLVFTSALFFGLAAVTRTTLASYVAGILLLIGYMIAGSLTHNIESQTLAALSDPFGLTAFSLLTRYWTPAEFNAQLTPLRGVLLANRMLWVGVGLGCLAVTYAVFQFSQTSRFERRKARLKSGDKAVARLDAAAPSSSVGAPAIVCDFSAGAGLRLAGRAAWLEFRGIVGSLAFLILALAGVLFIVTSATQMGQMYGTITYPVTYQVLEITSGTFALFMLIIITVFAGELVWKERGLRLDQMLDALPTPGWIAYAGKLGALALMTVALMGLVMACGLVIQAAHGYFRFEVGQYLVQLFGYDLSDYLLIAVLSVFVQVLAPNKYVGYVIMIGYYVAYLFMDKFGLEHNLFRYGSDPGLIYSDMNGYLGFMIQGVVTYKLYWGACAGLLALVSYLFWQRGVDRGTRMRWRAAQQRFGRPLQLTALALIAAFVGVGAVIYYNTNVLNVYRTSFQSEAVLADYEKQYKQYETLPQPKITDVRLNLDLYPQARRFAAAGVYQLQNTTTAPIDTVHLRVMPEIEIRQLSFDRAAQPVTTDVTAGYHIYQLAAPLQPGERSALTFEIAYAPRGFRNSMYDYASSPWVFPNGTFLTNDVLPRIGYTDQFELHEDDVRKKHGLAPKRAALPDVDDLAGRMTTGISPDGDWITYAATVSTDADQVALTPGNLERTWVDGDRRYFQYSMGDIPMGNFFAVLSGKYAVKTGEWQNIPIDIYYHPGHEYNLERMMRGVQQSLDYYTTHFGPYPFGQVRIVEFPRYSTFAQAFQGLIPFSEGIGFIARVRPGHEQDVDYPFYVTAHEMGHQWWGHQVSAANVQGGSWIMESVTQYAAMMVMEQEYGPAQMKRFLKYELDHYLSGRAFERKHEPPLYRADTQGYVYYNKGSVAMYALRDYIGADRVNLALRNYLRASAFQAPPYTNSRELLAHLRAVTPAAYQYVLRDLFETITLFRNRAVSAQAAPLPDGGYEVRLTVAAQKLRADETGAETDIPLNDAIDIGVLDADGQALYLAKHWLTQPETEFVIIVDDRPAKAGIDVYYKLIDRDPDDNVITVGVPKR